MCCLLHHCHRFTLFLRIIVTLPSFCGTTSSCNKDLQRVMKTSQDFSRCDKCHAALPWADSCLRRQMYVFSFLLVGATQCSSIFSSSHARRVDGRATEGPDPPPALLFLSPPPACRQVSLCHPCPMTISVSPIKPSRVPDHPPPPHPHKLRRLIVFADCQTLFSRSGISFPLHHQQSVVQRGFGQRRSICASKVLFLPTSKPEELE